MGDRDNAYNSRNAWILKCCVSHGCTCVTVRIPILLGICISRWTFVYARDFCEPVCAYMCTCHGEPPCASCEMLRVEIARIRANAGCVLRTEVPLHRVITAFYPHTLTQECLQAREARDPVEPGLNRAPGAPSRRASGSALGPTPALLAPGARESGGFPACLRQETRTSLPPTPTHL